MHTYSLLCDALGSDDATEIIYRLSGQQCYIPHISKITKHHHLVNHLNGNINLARKLATHFAHDKLRIPTYSPIKHSRLVTILYEQNLPIIEIAFLTNLHSRYIYELLSQPTKKFEYQHSENRADETEQLQLW